LGFRGIVLPILVSILILGTISTFQVAFSQTPQPNGQIVFTDSGSVRGIYVMNSDGSGVTLINSNDFDIWPQWSPDGIEIVFTSQRLGHGQEIYKMNADGTSQTRLTDAPFASQIPSWSPDGTKITFVSNRDGGGFNDIWVMDADGNNPVPLTGGTEHDGFPKWSPDGSKIVYQSTFVGHIWVMDADGGNQTPLATVGNNDHPNWSPDGTLIVFESTRSGDREVWTMDPSGGNLSQLTNDGSTNSWPTWSPDGTKILFVSQRSGDVEFWTMDPNGDNQTIFSTTSDIGIYPDWGTNTSILETTLTIIKQSIAGDDLFIFTNTNSTGTSFFTLNTQSGFASTETIDIVPGELQIVEELVSGVGFGFLQTGKYCEINGVPIPGNSTSFIPSANDQVICKFTNEKYAEVIIEKSAIGNTGTFEFVITNSTGTFVVSVNTNFFPFHNTNALPNESQTITENVPLGWNLTGKYCEINGVPIPGNSTFFIPSAGDQILCKFTNDELTTIKITKIP